MPLPRPIPDPLVELIAHRLRVLGQPLRIKLLDRLQSGEASVQELADELDALPQNVSQHLGLLYQAGMVSRRQVGSRACYAIADLSTLSILLVVSESLGRQLAEIAKLIELPPVIGREARASHRPLA